MTRCFLPAAIGAALLVSACHKKQQQVTVPPVPSPTQPRTVATKPKLSPRKNGQARKQTVTAAVPTPAPEQTPKLVDFLTDEQRQQYDREITASLQAAEENLSAFRQYGPAAKQKEADRVDSLIRQSRQERDAGDLSTARKLATMAKVVSESLKK